MMTREAIAPILISGTIRTRLHASAGIVERLIEKHPGFHRERAREDENRNRVHNVVPPLGRRGNATLVAGCGSAMKALRRDGMRQSPDSFHLELPHFGSQS